MMKIKIFSILLAVLLVVSCKTKQVPTDLSYMRNIEQTAIDAAKATPNTLQKGDRILVVVSGKDQDVVKPFNQNYSSSQMINNVAPGGNTATPAESLSGPMYTVDDDGDIEFPILGKIQASGKTVDELRDDLHRRLTKYLINPTVTARITNYKISVLGEVAKPGQYIIPDGQTTLLNALGLAGDLTMYGRRDNVLVVRTVDGAVTKQYLNLQDANTFNSPFFNLKQGDLIYVSPSQNREIMAKQNPNTGLYISVASVALGLLGLLVTVFKK